MPSGKQVLLKVLQELSQSKQNDSELIEVSERVRSSLCAHCSTSGETMEKIKKMGWLSYSEDGEVFKQGLGLNKSRVFLSDLFEELITDDKIPERIKMRFPDLSQEQYSTGLDMIWWLLSALQYWEELSGVENHGDLDKNECEKLLAGYRKWLKGYETDPW